MVNKTGVVLINLGSPEEPTKRGVSKFLREFLSDRRVVELPFLIWQILLNGLVIPLRAKRVAGAYQAIWLNEGSPLRVYTEELAEGIDKAVKAHAKDRIEEVTWAMTYGSPSIAMRVVELSRSGIDKILLLPLYPQYSSTTTGAVYDRVANLIRKERNIPDIYVIKDYYSHPAYIEALAHSVERHWAEFGRKQKLLISFHGVPEAYVAKGDPYRQQCEHTASALADYLGLQDNEWVISYQSRFGKQRWLQPYTDKTLESWAKDGVESVDVICPSFAVDCLETLEEINIENRDLFVRSGGKRFSMIPCLNSSDEQIRMLNQIIEENIH